MHSLTAHLVSLISALSLVGACHGKGPTGPAFAPGGTRVLFIGNSLTYSNNLPGMYIALARLAGNTTVEAASVAFPDFALEDHWAEGTARRALGPGTWEFVVMQQGSSALPASQVNLRTWATQFAPAIRSAGAEPVMFMVWPTTSRVGDFPAVLQSYRDAALEIGGLFAPAGDAWTAFGDLPALYSADGLHPSVRGTYLAALVLLERTLGIRPGQLPATIPGTAVGESDVRALQQAAQVALDRNPARPVGATPPPSLPTQPAKAIVDSGAQTRSSFRAASQAWRTVLAGGTRAPELECAWAHALRTDRAALALPLVLRVSTQTRFAGAVLAPYSCACQSRPSLVALRLPCSSRVARVR